MYVYKHIYNVESRQNTGITKPQATQVLINLKIPHISFFKLSDLQTILDHKYVYI